MVLLDWKRILSSSAKDFSDEEKDDLFNSIAWYEVEPNLDVDRCKVIFNVAQEILKYKGEQVESLVVELDELAARQGAEEAQRHRDLIEEVDDLKRQLTQSQKRGTKSSRRNSPENENLRHELLECELSNEKLLTELKEREREVLMEKREAEKLAAQVVSLEREKSELRRELATVQHETSSQQEAYSNQDPAQGPSVEQMLELTESIRQKNKHISQLLNDVETVEKENLVLREKLSDLRDKLSEATKHITQMIGELTGLKLTCEEQEEKINAVEEQNAALRAQVQELVAQKLCRDSELDDFSVALDSRVHDWKKLTERKEAEIEELKARLSRLSAQAPNIEVDTERSRVALLMQTLQTRETQIEALQNELAEATKAIHNTASIIEELKAKKSRRKTVDVNVKLKTELQLAEEQIKLLENKIQDAEEDSRAKAEELTDLIIQLRQYETGEYGLIEAVGEIKDLRQQRKVRDKQIEDLIQASNKLQAEAGHLEEQNIALREKLGLPPDAPVNVDGVLSLRRKEQALMHLLQHQAERLEEEKLQLKLENRKLRQRVERLCRQIETLGDKADVSSAADEYDLYSLSRKQQSIELKRAVEGEETQTKVTKEELERQNQRVAFVEGKFQELIKENESLRKGMHEILDSIHSQDSSGTVHLESQCLERLLEALDSRHVSGWYHPAMRLQGQLQLVEGSNAVLREQLREARSEETKAVQQLQQANFKIEQLEHSLTTLQEGRKRDLPDGPLFEEMVLPPNMSLSSAEIVAKLNVHLLHVLNEYNNEAEQNKTLEKRLEEVSKEFNIVRHQMGLLYKQYGDEVNEWKAAEAKFIEEKESLESSLESLKTKVQEFDNHWTQLDKSEDEQKRFISESARKLAEAKSNEVVAIRKCKFLQNLENQLRKVNLQLNEQLSSVECDSSEEIGKLKRHKEMSMFRIASLQKALDNSVPITKLDAANKEINELTSKYRDLLQKEQSLISENQLASRLEGEVEILHKDKVELTNALQGTREKLHSLEVLVMSLDQDTVTQDTHDNQIAFLTKKLATLEMKELNEKQRADHADGMYQIVKGQLVKLEEWNSEVVAQNKILIEKNLEFQQVERELRDNLTSYVSREELQQVEGKLSETETRLLEVKLEKETLSEMFDIAQEQVRSLELRKTSADCELDSLKQLVLNLQAASEDKVIIAHVSHELMSARLAEAAANKTLKHLQNEVLKLRTASLHQEANRDRQEKDFNQMRHQLTNRCQSLRQVIQILRRQYSGSVPLTKVERFSESLRQLREEQCESRKALREAELLKHDTETKKELLEAEKQSVNELKQMLTSDSVQAVDWYNKCTELRLKELQARNKVEFLETQLEQAEERFRNLENYVATLERDAIYEERNVNLLRDESVSEMALQTTAPVPTVETPPATVTVKPSADLDHLTAEHKNLSQALLKSQAEAAQLKQELASMKQQVKAKDSLLAIKDQALAEKPLRSSVVADTSPEIKDSYPVKNVPESKEKLALQATVESLKSIVSQKEDTISRLQLLIKESRDEHSRAAAQCQDELRGLQTALANQQQAYTKLKAKIRQSSRESKPSVSTIEQYIARMHELEDEVAELNTVVGNLSNQLVATRGEADRWRNLADDRLQNMGELRQRLEDQHRAELQVYQIEAQRYQTESENCRQDLNKIQEEFQQQMELALRGPTSSISTLQAQAKDKDEAIILLNETLAKVRHEMTQKSDDTALNKVARAKSADDVQSIKKQLKDANAELKAAKDELHKLQMKYREALTKKKEEFRTEREEAEHKKIKAIEDGFREEKEKLEKETSETLKKRVRTAEEVARWEERKKCQHTIEKLKERLAEKTKEEEKLLKTDRALRDTIARLDREKISLMSRSSKGSEVMEARIESAEAERAKLVSEVVTLKNKLEAHKHHSGGLGAAMLEERLEAQQRRITTLELAKKGSKAVTDEFEKLQESNAILKKANLRLESENLELRLDFERLRTDAPRLKEKVTHLEKYISILKAESSGVGTSDSDDTIMSPERKSVAELEKTILVLKRVVEKLQTENKRLTDTRFDNVKQQQAPVDHLQRELASMEAEKKKLQDHYLMAMEQTASLESQLDQSRHDKRSWEAKVVSLTTECEVLKSQLVQKTMLVDRVKGLLQRAAAKEKALHEQVVTLQRLVPSDSMKSFSSQSNMSVR